MSDLSHAFLSQAQTTLQYQKDPTTATAAALIAIVYELRALHDAIKAAGAVSQRR